MIVKVMSAVSGRQGPAGSLVVAVSVTEPTKPAGGVKVVLVALESAKVPPTEDVQVTELAAPPKIEVILIGLSWQAVGMEFILTVAC
jgi:hypothetical protein